ncbi:MAG: class II fructose-bisphosphate aldolase [Bacteroidales bacterium]|nr:class II fructose-bisphosphate aldolase [Bacteroidales bacterium]
MLVNLQEILTLAEREGKAIGMFNATGFDSLQAIVAAAEELNEPVILAHAEVHNVFNDISMVGPAMLAVARDARVPVCVHLDHGESLPMIEKAVDLGFTSIMIDASARPYEENVALTRWVVELCHPKGIGVEAELGRLATREDESVNPEDFYTDPDEAADFIRQTGIDALAIAFGTAHGFYKSTPVLDFDVIASCRKSTGIPLVMHGGSGVSPEDYTHAIRAGIRKINYYSYMSKAGYNAAAEVIASGTSSYLHDVEFAAMKAMKEDVCRAIRVFSGK